MSNDIANNLIAISVPLRNDAYYLLHRRVLRSVVPQLADEVDEHIANGDGHSMPVPLIEQLINVCADCKLPVMTSAQIAALINKMQETGVDPIEELATSLDAEHEAYEQLGGNQEPQTEEKEVNMNPEALKNYAAIDAQAAAKKESKNNLITAAANGEFIIGSISEDGESISVATNPRRHLSITAARAEATRLASVNPGKRFVPLQLTGSVVVGGAIWN